MDNSDIALHTPKGVKLQIFLRVRKIEDLSIDIISNDRQQLEAP